MADIGSGWAARARQVFSGALSGAPLLVFSSALILAAYWLGGEGMMIAAALALPAFLVVTGAIGGGRQNWAQECDSETGLAKRAMAERELTRALLAEDATGRTAAAIAIEIDDLDEIRARFGDGAASALLQQVAERLKSHLRDSDIVVRLSESRFGIAVQPLRRADLETMIELCARLQAQLAEPFAVDATRIYATASAGFALPGRVPNSSGDQMFRCAEQAIDDARSNGPGSIRAYSANLSRRLQARQALTSEIADALENGQIGPWFMPQVSTDDGRITGFEACPRWDHPECGQVRAEEFQGLVTAQGGSTRLSEIMLGGAVRALAEWDKAGLEIPGVSLMFANARLSDPRICDKVRWELDRFDLAPARLVVAIHEDVVAAADDEVIVRNVTKLAELGCRIELDDFGTGHASIANIRRFAVSRIKIDKGFVARVDRDRDQQNMVTAVLTMAERLSLDTLADGVETAGEHAMLAQLGCHSVQGHSVARPMRQAETAGWIAAHTARLPRLSAIRPGPAG